MKEKIIPVLKTFIITLSVAFIATDQQNFVYNILDTLGYGNDLLKKTVLSAVITLFIGIMSILISYLWAKIKTNMKKMNVLLITKLDGTKKSNCKFMPNNYEYDEKDVEVEIVLNPGGRIPNLLIKKLGFKLDIYFNPELLDVSFFDKWDSDEAGAFKLSERNISINLLGEIEIKGKTFQERSHKLNEQFKVKPIRVKNAETALDYAITSDKFGKITRIISGNLLSIECEPLKVTCKGE
ncbi:TPA: hypothetical protein QCO65_004656 [Bacillus cereus]|uniref:hypothetical protein n=1 Tax=Bacillus sp. FSL H8-0545 TaxID=2921402 RepID=UPI0030FBC69D|nr:hypothetical protein [Bacillus cereus]